jgi:hypothetical protein
MRNNEVFFDPCYKVIFEGPFNNLMKQIGGYEFVNVCTWKVIGEGLQFDKILSEKAMIYLTITSETMPCSVHNTGTS